MYVYVSVNWVIVGSGYGLSPEGVLNIVNKITFFNTHVVSVLDMFSAQVNKG